MTNPAKLYRASEFTSESTSEFTSESTSELIALEQSTVSPIRSRFRQLLQTIQEFCTQLAARGLATLQIHHELQVHQYYDRSGHCWWRIKDPATGISNSFATEEEALVWLERRYLR